MTAPITALIAEDEEPQRTELRGMLATLWPELIVVAECEDGISALDAWTSKKPDVAFLDIRMPGLGGLEVARQAGSPAQVVFITAHDEFAVKAFDAGAIDYLLKPIRTDRLTETVARLRNRQPATQVDLTALIDSLAGRLTLALAGAGLALTVAIAFATFVKLLGIGLLGAADQTKSTRIGAEYGLAVVLLGLAVLAAAVGLPVWLIALDDADVVQFGVHSAQAMSSDWLLVPLTDKFAFISPSKLVIAMPLLAILPLLLLLNARRHAIRRARVWYGGLHECAQRAATTSLTFANAMRTFYSFIYRPTLDTAREHRAVAYFIRRLEFQHDVADVFGPLLFTPIRRGVWRLAGRLRALQSGDLNFYLALIGALLLIILALTLR